VGKLASHDSQQRPLFPIAKKKKQNSTGKKLALQQPVSQGFYQNIKAILEQTVPPSPYCAVSFAMVMAYWEIGRLIVEE
jgi:hypothetical protein